MTIAQLKTVERAGCEIMGHGSKPLAPKTKTRNSNYLTIEKAEEDGIAYLKPLLEEGFNPVRYCYPYGSMLK